MNGEAMVLKADVVIFPLKSEQAEISTVEMSEITKLKKVENRVVIQETRFVRLKKSLRKRSANIL